MQEYIIAAAPHIQQGLVWWLDKLTEDIPVTHQIKTSLWLYCIWVGKTIVLGGRPRPLFAPIANQDLRLCSGSFRTSLIESLQVELSLKYYMKLKADPDNPAYSCVINPEFQRLFKSKPLRPYARHAYFGYQNPTPSGGHGGGTRHN